ncbi:MAG: response regulator [Steroidobacteraceae bacterium]
MDKLSLSIEHVQPNAPGARVLVVDDNHDAADSTAMLLELAGYETRAVYSGVEVLSSLETYAPDILVLDIGLPDLTGFELARQVKEAGSAACLIALSGFTQQQYQQQATAAGFDAYLLKPVEPEALEKVIAGLMQKRR